MKAKKVYEFKRTRKQGLSKQTEIGLIGIKKMEIEEWLNKHIPNDGYEIKDDLSIEVFGGIYLSNGDFVNEMPDNMTVHGSVNLVETGLTKLPENLTVLVNLDISDNPIEELPNGLYVKHNLFMVHTLIKEMPDDLVVEGIIQSEYSEYY